VLLWGKLTCTSNMGACQIQVPILESKNRLPPDGGEGGKHSKGLTQGVMCCCFIVAFHFAFDFRVCTTCFNIRPLCNIFLIATGVPYSESPRTNSQSGPILINIGCKLTCFGPFKVLTYLGGGPLLAVLGVLSKIIHTIIINITQPTCDHRTTHTHICKLYGRNSCRPSGSRRRRGPSADRPATVDAPNVRTLG
jgi:hypothetical protein